MSYCTNCGEALNVDDRFCRNCGTKLNPAILKKKSSEESISESDVSNQESSNAIPKSKKLIATDRQNKVDDEAYEEAYKKIFKPKKSTWFATFFFGFCGVLGLIDRNWEIMWLFFGLFMVMVLSIYGLNKLGSHGWDQLSSLGNSKKNIYQVGKAFWLYRKSAEQKIKLYTYGQIGVLLMLLLMLITGNMNGSLVYLIVGVVSLQVFKNRVKLHTIVDEPTLFELEERGIIELQEIVKSLYKDFESWNNVKQGSKILVLTTDKLAMIKINSIDEYEKIECRLRSIKRVSIIRNGEYGQGLLFSIGTNDNNVYLIKLGGESFQDSPEEFLSTFFQALDEALTQTGGAVDYSKNADIDNISPRHIDL